MDEAARQRLHEELRDLQHIDPARLIEKYRIITGEPATNQLPYHVSFAGMIEAIMQHEERPGVS